MQIQHQANVWNKGSCYIGKDGSRSIVSFLQNILREFPWRNDSGIDRWVPGHVNGFMQKRHSSIANVLDLHLFCINLISPWCRILVQVTASCLFGAKPLPQQMLTFCQLDPKEQIRNEI